MTLDPPVALAGAGLAASALALVLARWRDLGGPAAALAASGVLLRADATTVGLAAGTAALLAAAAARGAARAVGHPALTWAVLAAALAGGLAPAAARPGFAAAVVLVGALAGALALRRPTALRVRARFVGPVPVAGAAPPGPAAPGPDRA